MSRVRLVTVLLLFQAVFVSSVFARDRFFGYSEQGGKVVLTSGVASSLPKVQGSYPQATVTVTYTGGAAGTVSTSGTAVTLLSGTPFNSNGQWNSLLMTINSVTYTVSSCASATACTLSSSAGTQTSVLWSMPASAPAAIFSDNAGTAKSNPFTSDISAFWFFYADDGTYTVTFSGTGVSTPFTWSAFSGIDPFITQTGGTPTLLSTAVKLHPYEGEYSRQTSPVQAMLNNVPPNGYLTISGINNISTGLTLSTDRVTVKCDPGAKLVAAASNIKLLTISGNNDTLDSCLLDGSSGTRTLNYLLYMTSGSNFTSRYSIYQNADVAGMYFSSPTGFIRSSHDQFLNIGTVSQAGVGFTLANASTSNPGPSEVEISYPVFDNMLSDNSIHMFQGNMAERTIITVDHGTFTRQARAAIEGDTGGALSVKLTNNFIDGFANNTGGYLAGISWAMIDGLYPSGDLNGDLTLSNNTIRTTNTALHGLGEELFGYHVTSVGDKVINFGSCVVISGSIFVSDLDCNGGGFASTGFSQNPTFESGVVKIESSKFINICSVAVGAFSHDLDVSHNSFWRLPGVCAADASTNYKDMIVGASDLISGAPGNGSIRDNHHFVTAAAIPGSFTWTAIRHQPNAGESSIFDGDTFTNLNVAAFGTPLSSTVNFNQTSLNNLVFTNMASVGFNPTGLLAAKHFNNLDLTGNLSSYILSNGTVSAAGYPSCTAFTRGQTLNVSDSTSTTWGATSGGGGTNQVIESCNPTAPVASGTYTSGITATGTSTQTCNLKITGSGGVATATVALTGTNDIATGTALVITAGGGFITAPTAAVATSGTATCSGSSVVVATVLGAQVGYTIIGK